MHDALFADSFRPPTFTVLGLPLLDYTIGHELLMWKHRNPVVTHTLYGFKELPVEEKARALSQAVFFCCRRAPRWGWLWTRRCVRMDLDTQIAAFYNYRACGAQDLPTVKMPRANGVPFHYFGGPELARLINYISEKHEVMTRTHFGGAPLNFPFGLAKVLYSTHLETEGAIWVENYQDIKQREQRDAFDLAHPENTLAVGDDAVQAQAEKWNREHPEAPVPLMHKAK